MLDFIELSNLLSGAEALVNASECHGFLCGQVCVSGMPDDDLWQEFLDVQSGNDDLVNECYLHIHGMIREISGCMQSRDLDFQLLLPDLDSALEDRVEALADWCHGFLNGFGAGIGAGEVELTEDCRDILEDYTKICRAGLEDDAGEEDERALMDLIEYVRMSAIMVFDESNRNFPSSYLKVMH